MNQEIPSKISENLSKSVDQAHLAYRPLHQARREIRLVQLGPNFQSASNGDRVPLLRMHHAFFHGETEQLPQYIALSYTWGTGPKNIVLIEDEGRPARELPVSRNLLDALCHFAGLVDEDLDALKRVFWVDQLCINQNDNDEKSDQVRMMTNIFGQAKKTAIWYGSVGRRVKYEMMDWYNEDIGHVAEGTVHDPQLRSNDSSASKRLDRILSELCENDWEQLHALTSCCEHPWLGRAWVVQEVVVSRCRTVYWEDGRCDWSQLEKLWYLLFYLQRRAVKAKVKDLHRSQAILELSEAIRTLSITVLPTTKPSRTKSLIDLIHDMQLMGKTEATQPQDLIYSMLGIASDGDTCGIAIDYGKHYTEVFKDMTMYLMNTTGAHGLAWSGQDRSNTDTDGFILPSWVPDFRLQLGFMINRPKLRLFSATGESNFEYTVDGMRNTIFIRTFYVDKFIEARHLGSFSQDGNTRDDTPWDTRVPELASFLDAAADRSPTRYDKSAWEEMHWRLPLTDRFYDGHVEQRAGLEVKDWYIAFMQSEHPSSASAASKAAKYKQYIDTSPSIAFVTDTGYIGVGSSRITLGDELHLVQGSDTPFVLRKTDGRYELVSEAYVHGIMDGELVDDNTKFDWLEIH
ncbi:MAG: hypothetical protein Q9169_007753 [Polycauliona sp. 2 TL-2023]